MHFRAKDTYAAACIRRCSSRSTSAWSCLARLPALLALRARSASLASFNRYTNTDSINMNRFREVRPTIFLQPLHTIQAHGDASSGTPHHVSSARVPTPLRGQDMRCQGRQWTHADRVVYLGVVVVVGAVVVAHLAHRLVLLVAQLTVELLHIHTHTHETTYTQR